MDTSTAPTAPAGAIPPSAVGRFAFRALVPALLLPAVIVLMSLLRVMGIQLGASGVDWLVTTVFCFILLGSMTLNTWLLLSTPQTWQQRALPPALSIALIVLWSLEVVLALVLPALGSGTVSVVIAVLIMLASIVVFLFAFVRRLVRVASVPVTAVGLSRYSAVLGWGYLALTAVSVIGAAVASLAGGWGMAVLPLITVGLPWSWPLAVLAFVVGLMLDLPVLGAIFLGLIVVGVALNVFVVIRLLTNPAFRVRFVNRLFRLGGSGDPQASIRTFAPGGDAPSASGRRS